MTQPPLVYVHLRAFVLLERRIIIPPVLIVPLSTFVSVASCGMAVKVFDLHP